MVRPTFVSALARKAFFARHKNLVKRLTPASQDTFHSRTLNIAAHNYTLRKGLPATSPQDKTWNALKQAGYKLSDRSMGHRVESGQKAFRGTPAKVRRVKK